MDCTLSKENETQISKLICRYAKTYFEDENNRRAFEKWYKEHYGKVYKWKLKTENQK